MGPHGDPKGTHMAPWAHGAPCPWAPPMGPAGGAWPPLAPHGPPWGGGGRAGSYMGHMGSNRQPYSRSAKILKPGFASVGWSSFWSNGPRALGPGPLVPGPGPWSNGPRALGPCPMVPGPWSNGPGPMVPGPWSNGPRALGPPGYSHIVVILTPGQPYRGYSCPGQPYREYSGPAIP